MSDVKPTIEAFDESSESLKNQSQEFNQQIIVPGNYAYFYKDVDIEILMTFQTLEEMKAYVAEITKES